MRFWSMWRDYASDPFFSHEPFWSRWGGGFRHALGLWILTRRWPEGRVGGMIVSLGLACFDDSPLDD